MAGVEESRPEAALEHLKQGVGLLTKPTAQPGRASPSRAAHGSHTVSRCLSACDLMQSGPVIEMGKMQVVKTSKLCARRRAGASGDSRSIRR